MAIYCNYTMEHEKQTMKHIKYIHKFYEAIFFIATVLTEQRDFPWLQYLQKERLIDRKKLMRLFNYEI